MNKIEIKLMCDFNKIIVIPEKIKIELTNRTFNKLKYLFNTNI